MEWDTECLQIANRAGSMCWLHEEAAKIYEKWDTIGTTLVNVGTSLLGGIAFTFLAAANPDKIYIILFQVATLGLGISVIIVNSFAWRSKAPKHRVLVGKNDSIFSQIRKELRKPLPSRAGSKHFHENVIDLESEVRQEGGSLSIPPQVYLKYKEKTRICKGSSLISLNEKNHHMSNKVSLNKTVILQLIYKQMSFLLRDVDVL